MKTSTFIIASIFFLATITSFSQVQRIDSIVHHLNSEGIVSIGSIKGNSIEELCLCSEGQAYVGQKDNLVYAQERIKNDLDCTVIDFYYVEMELVYVIHSTLKDQQISTTEIYLENGEIILFEGDLKIQQLLLLKGEAILVSNNN